MQAGTKVGGPADLRAALVKHSDAFVQGFTVKLLTYALGRGLEYYDMPTVRSIDRAAAKDDNRFMTLVMGIGNIAALLRTDELETDPVLNKQLIEQTPISAVAVASGDRVTERHDL